MSDDEFAPPALARDGTRRGLHRRGQKNRRTQLLEAIQQAVERDTGIKEWDPVVMMAVVAARAFSGYPATDNDGNPIIDERGYPVMIPPDPALATAAAAKVAPYLHAQMRPKEMEDDEDGKSDVEDTREAVIEAFRALGVPIKETAHE